MDPSPILSIIHTVTIGTNLNFNGGNNGHGLKKLHVDFHNKFVQVITFTFENTQHHDPVPRIYCQLKCISLHKNDICSVRQKQFVSYKIPS